MSQNLDSKVAVIGIDIGKNLFHVVGHDARGAIVLRLAWQASSFDQKLKHRLCRIANISVV
jgi:transposase